MPFSGAFDAPDPLSCYRRSETVVPQQALAMTNSQLILNCSRALAATLAAECAPLEASESAVINAVFESILSRAPTEEERAACTEFLAQQIELLRAAEPPPAVDGLRSPSTDPRQRALEGLIRALYSHNDFVTIH